MKRNIFQLWRGLLLIVVAVALFFGMTGKINAAPYFQGKVITIVVDSSPGGGNDIFARFAARHLPRFIPGNPVFVVRNVVGGGGLIAPNMVWAAKPNGLMCLGTGGGNVSNSQMRPKGTIYKLEEMLPIYAGSLPRVYSVAAGIIKEPKDIVKAKGLIFGHTGPTSGVGSNFVWAKELLDIPVEKFVWGYGGSGAARLAFMSGEINMIGESFAGYVASIRPMVEKGQIMPVFQSGGLDANGNVVRNPIKVADVPTPVELYKQIYGKEPSGPLAEAYRSQAAQCTYSRGLVFPPKVPENIMVVLRNAAVQMVKDPQFQKEAELSAPGTAHLVGEELMRNYVAGVKASPETVEIIKKIYADKYGVLFE